MSLASVLGAVGTYVVSPALQFLWGVFDSLGAAFFPVAIALSSFFGVFFVVRVLRFFRG